MKKSTLLVMAILLTACTSAPDMTVTLTSAPPPTDTPIPTPTFHPQFAALQEQIAASGTRFTLSGADGLIYDGETPIPGITVAPDGTMTLTVNGETVTIDPADVSFDDEKGVSIEGFDFDFDANEWVEAISKSMQQANELIETYGLEEQIAEGEITVTEEDGVVNVVDNESGKAMLQISEDQVLYGIEFETKIAANSCESTPFVPVPNTGGMIVYDKDQSPTTSEYFSEIIHKEFKYRSEIGQYLSILLDRERQCWALTDGAYFFYRDKDGVAQQVP